MNRVLSFSVGLISGALVGAISALLLTPASGDDLRGSVVARWEDARMEARRAMDETRLQLEVEYSQMKSGDVPPGEYGFTGGIAPSGPD